MGRKHGSKPRKDRARKGHRPAPPLSPPSNDLDRELRSASLPLPYDDEPEIEVVEVGSPTPYAIQLADEEPSVSSRAPVIVPSVPPPPSAPRVTRSRFLLGLAAVAVVGSFLIRSREDFVRVLRDRLPAIAHAIERAPAAAKPIVVKAACPEGMALVDRDGARVCIDRFEASTVEISPTGEEAPYSPYLSVEGHRVKAVSVPNAVPQAYISRDEAERACAEAGKRLCSADEWRLACRGPDHTAYPYGDSEDADACNTHAKEPLGELFYGYGDQLYDDRVMNDPSLNALDGTVAKTGTFARCTSAEGVYDMVGNLHEWTAETRGEFHGGYYLDVHKNGDGCGYVTSAHAPTYHDYSTGFRCCKDAE